MVDRASQPVIRPLAEEDLSALEWNGEYAHFRRLYREIFQSSMRGKAVMWVAELPDQGIVGQVFVQLNSARSELADGTMRAYIYGFRVKPANRSRGIGTSLMDAAERDLRQRGYSLVTLNVGQENLQARHFYERRGYQVVAQEPGRWSYLDNLGQRKEVHEPAWRMEKILA